MARVKIFVVCQDKYVVKIKKSIFWLEIVNHSLYVWKLIVNYHESKINQVRITKIAAEAG